jgi:hypothetical protein
MAQQTDLFAAPVVADVEPDELGISHDGSPIIVSFGAGVDSSAMLVAMKRRGIIPDLILFADTGGEKRETYAFAKYIDSWLRSWGAPTVTWVRHRTTDRVSYNDLEGNCLDNETLPSLAFGRHSCSIKYKINPLDSYVKGVSRGPNKRHGWQPAIECWARGQKPIKLIGYDNGPADIRRRNRVETEDELFRYVFPLQHLGWARKECIQAIVEEGLEVPLKSACFFCPASKKHELWWLAGAHPDLFLRALKIERNALEGRHSRWDRVEFGDEWINYVRDGKKFPSKAQAGLGRQLSWFQFAVVNKIVDKEGNFIADRDYCLKRAAEERGDDNALDRRAA